MRKREGTQSCANIGWRRYGSSSLCRRGGRDTELVLELGADILKYSGVQEERRVLKRVCDRYECGAKGRCKR